MPPHPRKKQKHSITKVIPACRNIFFFFFSFYTMISSGFFKHNIKNIHFCQFPIQTAMYILPWRSGGSIMVLSGGGSVVIDFAQLNRSLRLINQIRSIMISNEMYYRYQTFVSNGISILAFFKFGHNIENVS